MEVKKMKKKTQSKKKPSHYIEPNKDGLIGKTNKDGLIGKTKKIMKI